MLVAGGPRYSDVSGVGEQCVLLSVAVPVLLFLNQIPLWFISIANKPFRCRPAYSRLS